MDEVRGNPLVRINWFGRVALAVVSAACGVFPLVLRAQTQAEASRVPALIAALKDASPQVRENAAIALGQIGPAASVAIDSLMATFADEDICLRGVAAIALGRIGQATVPALTSDRTGTTTVTRAAVADAHHFS